MNSLSTNKKLNASLEHQKNIHPSQFFLAADNIALRQELFKTLKALNNQSELYFNECNLKRVNDLEKDNFYLRLY